MQNVPVNYLLVFSQGEKESKLDVKLLTRKIKWKNMRQPDRKSQKKILQHYHNSLRICQSLALEVALANFFLSGFLINYLLVDLANIICMREGLGKSNLKLNDSYLLNIGYLLNNNVQNFVLFMLCTWILGLTSLCWILNILKL